MEHTHKKEIIMKYTYKREIIIIAFSSMLAIFDFTMFFSGVNNRFVFLFCGIILVIAVVLNAYTIKLKRMSNELGKELEKLTKDLKDGVESYEKHKDKK